MESMHAGEDIKLLAEKSFKALFAFVARIYFNASILDHSQLVLELLSIGRIAVHQIFKSSYLCGIAFQALADLILEILDLDVLVKVW